MARVLRRFLLYFSIVNLASVVISYDLKSRLLNGNLVHQISDYPFIVSVYYQANLKNHCSGVIIRDDVVLTVAHCVIYNGLPYVVAGRTSLMDTNPLFVQPRRARRVILHPKYSHEFIETSIYDIAAIILDERLHFNQYVNSINLPGAMRLPVDEIATVAGWGKTELAAYSSDLRAVQLTILSFSECDHMMKGKSELLFISPELICAFDKTFNGKGTCSGDGGGPLFIYRGGYILLGLVEDGVSQNGQCFTNFPGTYVNVLYNKEFIDSVLG